MNVQASVAGFSGKGRFSGTSEAVEIVMDSTVCFAAHRAPRRCARCGTVFRGSVLAPLVSGRGAACPFCASPDTAPIGHTPVAGVA